VADRRRAGRPDRRPGRRLLRPRGLTSRTGATVALADLDGDGVDELIVGDPSDSRGPDDRVQVYAADGRLLTDFDSDVVPGDRKDFRAGDVGGLAAGGEPGVILTARRFVVSEEGARVSRFGGDGQLHDPPLRPFPELTNAGLDVAGGTSAAVP
jgi:hypothetical protein